MTRISSNVAGAEDKKNIEDISNVAEERATDDIQIDQGQPDPIPKTLHFELREDSEGKWNWVLWAANHRAIATNPRSYSRRNDAERAIRRMKDEAADAKIVVATM